MNSASPLSSSLVASHRRPELVVGPVVGSSSGSSAAAAAAAASAPGANNNNNNLPNYREQAALQQQILQVSKRATRPSVFYFISILEKESRKRGVIIIPLNQKDNI